MHGTFNLKETTRITTQKIQFWR